MHACMHTYTHTKTHVQFQSKEPQKLEIKTLDENKPTVSMGSDSSMCAESKSPSNEARNIQQNDALKPQVCMYVCMHVFNYENVCMYVCM